MTRDYSRDGLLQVVREVWTERDPMPAGLVERMQAAVEAELAIAGTDFDVELLMLVSREEMLAGARGTATYTLRFSSDDIDLLVRAVGAPEGGTRLDGWVSPAGPVTVHATPVPDTGRSWEVESDDTGRFEFTDLPAGMVRLHLTPRDTGLKPFATPAFEI
ncbi:MULTISPECIES: hypothetical protein [unclassified Nocardioides]|uniref:hypothetical protein n=1 Tax=unclassified Nocardioides TaxID=2615069 RepID=UPI0006FDCF45|nr:MULTISPECIES: hypothetical protein [unclassified Nocardioides]KQY57406.1 hypothetical protein ASD30_14465 [Nocardioides sp. Root140]KQZ68918.1 hypothetical protein ASD66_16880 [Nocardioides sp. Root151]KRF20404.1 hypothetical protein ASH02_22100 [Nocardioides sp. Soil796]